VAEVRIAKGQYYEKEGQWRWRTVGGNGEPIGYGESYPDVRNAIAALKAHLPEGVLPEQVDE
jgi:uncharacterized protein YegP (UPF0339 family)